MVFRVNEFSQMRMRNPEQWRAMLRIAIQKHHGVMRRVANELDVGYSSLKRWIAEEPDLKKIVRAVRRARVRSR
jgi:transcriptional regulator with PAS, ATPase and Fis domain